MKQKQQLSKTKPCGREAGDDLEGQMAELKILREQVRLAILAKQSLVIEAASVEESMLQ